MAGPGLAEIQSYKGDADLSGVSSTVIDNTGDLPYLQNAAYATSAATKAEAEQYQKNLTETLSSLDKINTVGIMDSDQEVLGKQVQGFFKQIYDNYDVVRNPYKNLTQASANKQAEFELRKNLERSRAQKAMAAVAEKQMAENPRWATPQNKAALEAWKAKPITERTDFFLTPPPVASITALASSVIPQATVKYASSDLVNKGQYIRTESGEYVDLEKLKEIVPIAMNENGEFGNQLGKEFADMYRALPPEQQARYNGYVDFVTQNVLALAKPKQVTTSKLDENQFAMQNDQQAFTAGQNALNRRLEREKMDLQQNLAGGGKINLNSVGSYKNMLLATAFTTGKVAPSTLQDIYGDNRTVVVTTYPIVGYDKKVDARGNRTNEDDLTKPIYDSTAGKTEQSLPSKQVVDTRLNSDGNLVVKLRDNATGKFIEEVKTRVSADNDFNNILGKDKASVVADGSRRWLKENTGSSNFNLEAAKKVFNIEDVSPTQNTPGQSLPKINTPKVIVKVKGL